MKLGVRILLVAFVCVFFAANYAHGGITKIVIEKVESPAFEGATFGTAGQFEKLIGRAYGEVDPKDPLNVVIEDIGLAPRNSKGNVEYSMDIYILKPIDMSKSNGKIFFDILNRGRKLMLSFFCGGPMGNDPKTVADVDNCFLFHQGYTLVWAGWESGSVDRVANNMVAYFPVPKNLDGTPIIGPHLDEFIFNNLTAMGGKLNYPAASTDQNQASLSVREKEADQRIPVPVSEWSFENAQQINIKRKGSFLSRFDAGAIYEFIYKAKDPTVMGLAYASTRDLASFLKNEVADDNPLRGKIKTAYVFGSSQSGRFLKDFIYWGFNQDEKSRMIFEGAVPHIAGARGIILNDRFATPAPISWQHQNHRARKMTFPFTYGVMSDPISGKTDGLLKRCEATNSCPKMFHIDGGNEYWGAAASLITTDSLGNDIKIPEAVRVYFVSSTQHVPGEKPNKSICQQLSNPIDYTPNLRALFVSLDEWVTKGIAPPPSQYPLAGNGTLISSLPQASQGFPNIPGVTYSGLINRVPMLDFATLPATPITGKEYTVLVPKVDADGNDLAGIRPVAIAVPVGTYMGWNLRAQGFAEGEQCDLSGSYIPFAQTKKEREASGDPRLSIEERYPTREVYVNQVNQAVDQLLRNRLLRQEDGDKIKKNTVENGIPK
jgi:hypothetical protein